MKNLKNEYEKKYRFSLMQVTESGNLCYFTIFFILLVSCAPCQGEEPSRTLSKEGDKVVYPTINPQTILIDDLNEEYREKEVIFGTFDSKLYILSLESMKSPFDISTNGNVKKIGVADITNDGKNELIIITEKNILSIYDSNGIHIHDQTFQDDVRSFAFLDGNKDGVTDIILATSTSITAVNVHGQCVWSAPVEIPSVKDLIVDDVDGFAEKEIIGYTTNSVFILKYNGGTPTFIDFSPYEITTLSMYGSDRKYIIVASSNGTLSWLDYLGERKDIQDFTNDVSKIIFAQTRIPSYTRNFLFIISDKGQAKAIDLSGNEIDNFGVYDNVLNIESANLDKKETQYSNIDYDETVISGSYGKIVILIHYFKERIEGRNKFEWLEIRNYTGDFEKVVFSQLVEEYPDRFILFQVSQKGEMQKYAIFFDSMWFFSLYDQVIQYYDLGDYVTAFHYIDTILTDSGYRELAEYYGLYEECITKQDECQRYVESEMMQAIQKLTEGMGKVDTDTLGAVKDLFEAYRGFKEANFRENDVVDEEKDLTIMNVKEMILHLVFPLLKEADEEYAEENYEKALRLFSAIYPAYEEFSVYPVSEEFSWYIEDLANENEEFEEYRTLIEKYPNHWVMLPIIDSCKENIEKDADNLFNEGRLEDAKDKYETIKMALIDKGESEDSNTVKSITDKIIKCDIGIRKSRTERCILLSFIWFPFLVVVFCAYKKRKFHKDSFQKYAARIIERKMWKNERVFAISFLTGFVSLFGFQKIVNPNYSLIGSISVFFLILVLSVFVDFCLFCGKSQKGKYAEGLGSMNAPRVFLSHSSKDKAFVEDLAEKLQFDGFSVWYDKWEIHVGDSIVQKINEGISTSDFLLVILSRNSVNSKWVQEELNAATIKNINSKGAFILPVLLEKCELPPLLSDKKYANFSENFESAYQELVEAINHHLRNKESCT